MTWSSGSNVPGAALSGLVGGTFFGSGQTFGTGSGGDTIYAALYMNTGTPNKDDTPASRQAYNGTGGQWTTTYEITGSTGYTPGGAVALGSKTNAWATGTLTIDAADTQWTSVTIANNAYGCLVYDNTVTAKSAFCWNYFGGAAGVTGGTFTIVWNTSGIFTITY